MKYLNLSVKLILFLALLILTLTFTACNMPFIGRNSPTPIPPVNTVTPTPLPPATVTPEPAFTNTPVHKSTPQSVPTPPHHLWDADSSKNAKMGYPASGDNFDKALLERPFSPGKKSTYFPELDILDSDFQLGSPWIYSNILLAGISATTKDLDGYYAVDVSVNEDGFGDFLILADHPKGSKWTTAGVQVWQDKDHDVDNPGMLLAKGTKGNGFETLLFDQGTGDDPDLAWEKIDANNPKLVWFAFKSSLIGDKKWAIRRAWAKKDKINPGDLDYFQSMDVSDAGNPIPVMANYPLKNLYEVDNTCRVAVNFYPSSTIPGLCPIAPTAGPSISNPGSPSKPSSPNHPQTVNDIQ